MFKLKYKLWIEQEGKAFGIGPSVLLKTIYKTGSLNNAAKEMKMSYSQAYNLVKSLEKRLGFTLIESKIGGSGGGGSTLTKEALELIQTFDNFSRESELVLEELFQKHFTCYLAKDKS